MSYSALYGITKECKGKVLSEYENSWLFSPIVWNVLSDKTLPRNEWGGIQSIIGLRGQKVWSEINKKMNKSKNTSDRVCWELSNQQIFFTKDKECVVEGVRQFVEQNKAYDKSEEDGLSPLEQEHIVERFREIADDIASLDENEFPYFVFKNTSVDDNVEFWFTEYDEDADEYKEKSLKDWDKFLAEFVVIKNGKITEFVPNTEYKY